MSAQTAVDQILDKIDQRLRMMTVARGYSQDLGNIYRAKLTPFKNGDLPALNYWATGLISERKFGKESHELSLNIEYYSRTYDKPFTDVAFDLAADVQVMINRAYTSPLVADTPSMALGGFVDDLFITSINPVIGEGEKPFCGVLLNITIKYQTDLNNPYVITIP
jgi:hypothetical protein